MRVVNSAEAMRMIGVSHASLMRMVKGGNLDGIVFKPAGINKFRFDADALEARIMEWKKQSAKVA